MNQTETPKQVTDKANEENKLSMDIFNSMRTKFLENLPEEEREAYQKFGEKFHSSFDVNTGSSVNLSEINMEEALAYVVQGLESDFTQNTSQKMRMHYSLLLMVKNGLKNGITKQKQNYNFFLNKMKFKTIFIKTLIYRIFVSLPFIFFLTYLFFKNFVRSIEYTITIFVASSILLLSYEYIYQFKSVWLRQGIIGTWFLLMITGCVLLKIML